MKITQAFPSKYLRAADIPAGRKITATIADVRVEKVGTGSNTDERPVLYFVGKQKGLVLNKINSQIITEIARTDETDLWRGLQISLYSTKAEFSGKLVDALRVEMVTARPNPFQQVPGSFGAPQPTAEAGAPAIQPVNQPQQPAQQPQQEVFHPAMREREPGSDDDIPF